MISGFPTLEGFSPRPGCGCGGPAPKGSKKSHKSNKSKKTKKSKGW